MMPKKRVAIIFSGLMRLQQASDESWLRFIREHDADVFVHTWQTDNQAMTDRMLKTYDPIAYQIDEPVSVDIGPYLHRQHSNISIYNIFSQWHSMQRGFRLMEGYYQSQGVVPDVIVRTRFDLLIHDFKLEYEQPLVISMEPYKEPCCVYYKDQFVVPQADLVAYGSVDSISKYCNTIDMIPMIFENSNFTLTSENLLVSSLYEQRVPFLNAVHRIELIRG